MLHLAAPYCCSSFKLHYFYVLFFSCHSVFIMNFFCGALFSSRTVFCVAMFSCCTFCALFSYCTFFHVGLFSCCTIFPLHFFFCSTLFMLQFFMLHFFQFGPSLLTCFLFYSFHDFIFHCCFFSHCTLFRLLVSSCTVFL